ncbi:short-chain dehydrogenase/reductase SDR [Clostridium sp. CAG:307]|nr:short-chain dehydrogenase/reductase SDR [Clostridium sp. CAG:307]
MVPLKKDSLEACHREILKDLGKCDILINGAGGNNPRATTDNEYAELGDEKKGIKTFFDLDEAGVEFVFNLNFIGTLLPTQIFACDMIGRKDCSILNISSMNAYTPLTKIPAYSGAKAAISNFTQWLAVHFSHVGIRCNAIAPGFFVTKQNEKLLYNDDGAAISNFTKWLAVHFSHVGIRCNAIAPGFFVTKQNEKLLYNDDGTPTARTEHILSSTPMSKFGVVDDLLGATLFLVSSEASSFVTGVCIPIDGGFSSYSGV